MGLAIQLDHRFWSKWLLNKLHRLGYTESYAETQNDKYSMTEMELESVMVLVLQLQMLKKVTMR